ncbi:class I SAM-dependent methyltransferase [Saccharibacillus sp. CPCC 101409]|uniref:class I SAM-dependent methyltransferase n=1 Tax=Saccharibacillus sp. CPCC 101409 TaxID=3058041 RepID=UPI00267215AD|nr:class I SAM-dependent methyltransferase [Saccharibacillus sp. CPCC 101409]MDO3411809.1 class I SAM-dependent methyltransferase [Saccharibacillus sp. CPCC 101409]
MHGLYEIVSWSLAGIVLLLLLLIVYASVRNGISPMPTSRPVRRMVMREIGRLPNRGHIVEAGSGFGTLALNLTRRFPLCKVTGVENSLIPLLSSRLLASANRMPRSRLSFRRGDLFAYEYENADLVVCYLHPAAMRRLGPILRERVADGTRVVSVFFAFDDWEPDTIAVCGDLYRTKVYTYTVRLPLEHPVDIRV